MDIYGLEKLSLVDYDGKVASTVFTGACNFRCPFCHNAPLVTGLSTLEPMDEKYIFDYLASRTKILDGVCITGGEPTLNADLPKFCEKLKALGYAVKLDTNGTNVNMIKTLVENGLCDYFAMDIKNDKAGYGKVVGIPNYDTTAVSKSIEYFLSGATPYEFRTTLIKEFHDGESISNMAKWIAGAKAHFLQKFKDNGACIQGGLSPVELDTANAFKDILSKTVKSVNLRGYDL